VIYLVYQGQGMMLILEDLLVMQNAQNPTMVQWKTLVNNKNLIYKKLIFCEGGGFGSDTHI
jgi:hypothetical protein